MWCRSFKSWSSSSSQRHGACCECRKQKHYILKWLFQSRGPPTATCCQILCYFFFYRIRSPHSKIIIEDRVETHPQLTELELTDHASNLPARGKSPLALSLQVCVDGGRKCELPRNEQFSRKATVFPLSDNKMALKPLFPRCENSHWLANIQWNTRNLCPLHVTSSRHTYTYYCSVSLCHPIVYPDFGVVCYKRIQLHRQWNLGKITPNFSKEIELKVDIIQRKRVSLCVSSTWILRGLEYTWWETFTVSHLPPRPIIWKINEIRSCIMQISMNYANQPRRREIGRGTTADGSARERPSLHFSYS